MGPGIAAQSVGVPGNENTMSSLMIGTTPFQSNIFTSNFKVRKVTRFMLGGGSEHHHTVSIRPSYLFDASRTEQIQRGTTNISVIVFHGGIVATQLGVDPAATTTSTAQINIVTSVRVKARMFERSLTSYAQWDNLLSLAQEAQYTVNEEVDAVQQAQIVETAP